MSVFLSSSLSLLAGGTSGGGSGTVTSVAVSGANGISVAGSPITTSGTIALSLGDITPTSIDTTGFVIADTFVGSGADLTDIPNNALVNSSITIGTTNIALGATSTTLDGLTSVTSTNFVGNITGSITGNASTATILQTTRTFSATGDATATAQNFNGSANVSLPMVLATVNSSPQTDTFRKITVNAKGLVTATSAVTAADITPILNSSYVLKAGDTMTGQLTISYGTPSLSVDATAPGTTSSLLFNVAGNPRWSVFKSSTAESGGGTGSAFGIGRYTDAGTFVDAPLTITRSSGASTFLYSVTGASFIPSGSAIPANGLFLPATNVIGLSTNTTERMRVDASGFIGIGATTVSGRTINLAKTLTGGGSSTAIYSSGAIASDVTTAASSFTSSITTAASAFTLPTLYHFLVSPTIKGAGSTITTQIGYSVSGTLVSGASNYAFHSVVDRAANTYNLAMIGTADNYLGGNTGINISPGPWGTTFNALEVNGAALWGKTDGLLSHFSSNLIYNGTSYKYKITGLASSYSQDGAHHWLTAPLGTVGPNATLTERMTLLNTGNLGINNTNPVQALDVVGNILASGTITATGGLVGNITGAASLNVLKAGDTMTGSLILNADPTAALGAATKQYVDSLAAGLVAKASCITATTVTLASSSAGTITYNNGAAGVGATLTTTGSFNTIGGATTVDGNRILVKNEATTENNGIYVRTSATILTRAIDFDNSPVGEIDSGDFTFISTGTLTGTNWVLTTPAPITVGTTGLLFTQLSGAGQYTAGVGIDITANQISNTGVLSTIGTANQISVSAATGNVTFSLPSNVTISGAMTAGSFVGNLTGNITGSASLNVLKAGDTMSGALTINTASTNLVLDRSGATNSGIAWRQGGLARWLLYNTTDGAGGNAGSDLSLDRYGDNGTLLASGAVVINRATGGVGIGAAPGVAIVFRINSTSIGDGTQPNAYQHFSSGVFPAGTTTSGYGSYLQLGTVASTFTMPNLYYYVSSQGTFGAGSTVSSQYGFLASSSLIGAANNYGFYGGLAQGGGRWNLYMGGTASNHIAGQLYIGSASGQSVSLGTSFYSTKLQVIGANLADSSASFVRFVNDASGAILALAKSRGAAIGSHVISQDGDQAGHIVWNASDGTNMRELARITGTVNGVPAASSIPGSITFSTNPVGANAVVSRMIINSAGNVGIGTTSSPWSSGLTAVDIGPNALGLVGADGFYAGITANLYWGNSGWTYKKTGAAAAIRILDGRSFIFSYASSGTAGAAATMTDQMVITDTGNIGFGEHPAFSNSKICTVDGVYRGAFGYINNGTFGVGATSAHPLVLMAGIGEKARLDTVGNFGVGTTNPQAKLHASGPDEILRLESFYGAGRVFMTFYDTVARKGRFGYLTAAEDMTISNDENAALIFSTNAIERLRIDATGSFGLSGANYGTSGQVLTSAGATSPPTWQTPSGGGGGSGTVTSVAVSGANGISVAGSPITTSGTIALSLGDITPTSVLSTGTATASAFIPTGSTVPVNGLYLSAPNVLGFSTNTTERVTINDTGLVGIGSAPAPSISLTIGKNLSDFVSTGVASSGLATPGSSVITSFVSYVSTAPSATISSLTHYNIAPNSKGAGSTITTQYGYGISGTFPIATNNYVFYSPLARATNTFNLYFTGSADNYVAGNLSIGSTPSAWSGVIRSLEVYGSALFANSNKLDAYLGANIYYDGGNWRYKVDGQATTFSQVNGTFQWSNAFAGTGGAVAPLNPIMSLDPGGNLVASGTITATGALISGSVTSAQNIANGSLPWTYVTSSGSNSTDTVAGIGYQNSTTFTASGAAAQNVIGSKVVPRIIGSPTGTARLNLYGMQSIPYIVSSAVTSNIGIYGGYFLASRSSTTDLSTNANNTLIGVYSTVGHDSSTPLSALTPEVTGVKSIVTFNNGKATNITGVHSQLSIFASESVVINTVYGFNYQPSIIDDIGFPTTITSMYGLRLQSLTAGDGSLVITNRYGISQEDALSKNWFAGRIGIGAGKTSPAQALDINGNALISGSVTSGQIVTNGSSSYVYTPTTGGSNTTSVATGLAYQNTTAFTAAGSSSQLLHGAVVVPKIIGAPTGGIPINATAINAGPYIQSSAATSSMVMVGGDFTAWRSSASDLSTSTSNTVTGLSGSAGHYLTVSPTATTRTVTGVRGYTFMTYGTATDVITIHANQNLSGNSTNSVNVTNAYGFNYTPSLGAGLGAGVNITNLYGIRLQVPQTNGGPINITNRYGISQEDTLANNFFAGNVGIGTNAPKGRLHISHAGVPRIILTDTTQVVDKKSWDSVSVGGAFYMRTISDDDANTTSFLTAERGVGMPAEWIVSAVTLNTAGSERVRVNASGAVGFNGSNFGSSGQVLTSAGSASPPTWQTPSGGGGGTTGYEQTFLLMGA